MKISSIIRCLRYSLIGIMCIILILALVACGNTDTSDTNTSDTADATGEADSTLLYIVTDKASEYRIIRPADCEDHVKDSANAIREHIKAQTGVNIRVISDGGDTPVEETDKEILVGYTNRDESADVYSELDYRGYKIKTVGTKITLGAYTEEAFYSAVSALKRKLLTTEDGASLYAEELNVHVKGKYTVSSITANGDDISKFAIVCDGTELEFAKSLRKLIGAYEGSLIEIYTKKDDVPDGKKPLYLGSKVLPVGTSTEDDVLYSFGKCADGACAYYPDTAGRTRMYAALELILKEQTATSLELSEVLAKKPKPTYASEVADLKIMSFNVLNGWDTYNIGNRANITAELLLSLMPDVVGFQEYDKFYREASGTPLQDQISESYTEVCPSEKSWNPIFYNKSTLTLITYGFGTYTDGTFQSNYPGGGKALFRTYSWAIFEHKDSGKQFALFNTHLDYSGDATTTQANQLSECTELLAAINSVKTNYGIEHVFLTGDYNANISSQTCDKLIAGGFSDTRASATEKDDSNTSGKLNQALSGTYAGAIDHIFYMGSNISVSNYQTITSIRAASDHCPIYTTLTINP